jgi:hypothetical protein
MTGAELAAILRVHARALGQNAHVMLETRADLRKLAQLLDPEVCTHAAYASAVSPHGTLISYRCLDCDHAWTTYT